MSLDEGTMKALLGLLPVMTGRGAPAPGKPVEVRIELDPGPEAETIKKAVRALSERTIENGIERLKLKKPHAAEEFMEVCRKVGIDMDEVKARLAAGAPQKPQLPAEQIVRLTRHVVEKYGHKK